jgi:hypothetical protein
MFLFCYPLFIVCRWSQTQAAAYEGGGVGLRWWTNTNGGKKCKLLRRGIGAVGMQQKKYLLKIN